MIPAFEIEGRARALCALRGSNWDAPYVKRAHWRKLAAGYCPELDEPTVTEAAQLEQAIDAGLQQLERGDSEPPEDPVDVLARAMGGRTWHGGPAARTVFGAAIPSDGELRGQLIGAYRFAEPIPCTDDTEFRIYVGQEPPPEQVGPFTVQRLTVQEQLATARAIAARVEGLRVPIRIETMDEPVIFPPTYVPPRWWRDPAMAAEIGTVVVEPDPEPRWRRLLRRVARFLRHH